MLQSAPIFDLVALLWFGTLICVYWLVTGYEPFASRTIVAAVQRQREQWMRNIARRDNRIVDAQLLGSLSQGNAFFASTSAIAVGGLAALMGSAEKIQAMLERLPFVASPSVLLEIKLLLLITIFIFAFFKFAWAFRLSHYAAIMIGSTPILGEGSPDACESHALGTARLVGIAAEHTNAGLRSFYYAIAAMAWFFHPLAFILVATWVLLILVRRDFFSRSRRLLSAAGL